ncbi:AcrR family transcriptional regulator [Mycobacterium sp. MAA66]|uniref:TetR/AcrR family transcriptional regulator C-terminal domain-containing protein n=1 Tax=Mycobacterium sp. MAA66 TaxID=3156297 RepID=UPI003513E034
MSEGEGCHALPKPLLSAEEIFDEALRVLSEEGAEGLTIRNLAGRLRCSNKTLYQQVGAHDVLIRGVVARAFSQLELAFCAECEWQEAAESWCMALRSALLDHPDLCKLMTTADRGVIVDYAVQLIEALQRCGFSHGQAVRAVGILTHVTLSMTLSDVAAPGQWDDPRVFATTVSWLLQGIAQVRTQKQRAAGVADVGNGRSRSQRKNSAS